MKITSLVLACALALISSSALGQARDDYRTAAWMTPLEPTPTACADPTTVFEVVRYVAFAPSNAAHRALLARAARADGVSVQGMSLVAVLDTLIEGTIQRSRPYGDNGIGDIGFGAPSVTTLVARGGTPWTVRYRVFVRYVSEQSADQLCASRTAEPTTTRVNTAAMRVESLYVAPIATTRTTDVVHVLRTGPSRGPSVRGLFQERLISVAPSILNPEPVRFTRPRTPSR
ncbi:MAG: hypothetical protein WCV84_01515 [Patescibacteria group bacterium]